MGESKFSRRILLSNKGLILSCQSGCNITGNLLIIQSLCQRPYLVTLKTGRGQEGMMVQWDVTELKNQKLKLDVNRYRLFYMTPSLPPLFQFVLLFCNISLSGSKIILKSSKTSMGPAGSFHLLSSNVSDILKVYSRCNKWIEMISKVNGSSEHCNLFLAVVHSDIGCSIQKIWFKTQKQATTIDLKLSFSRG